MLWSLNIHSFSIQIFFSLVHLSFYHSLHVNLDIFPTRLIKLLLNYIHEIIHVQNSSNNHFFHPFPHWLRHVCLLFQFCSCCLGIHYQTVWFTNVQFKRLSLFQWICFACVGIIWQKTVILVYRNYYEYVFNYPNSKNLCHYGCLEFL